MTDQINQCPAHSGTITCVEATKKKLDDLDKEHGEDVRAIHEKINNCVNSRISNRVLFIILGAMCMSALYLFDGATEARVEIKKMTLKNTETLEDLQDKILPSLTRIENKLQIPEIRQIGTKEHNKQKGDL